MKFYQNGIYNIFKISIFRGLKGSDFLI